MILLDGLWTGHMSQNYLVQLIKKMKTFTINVITLYPSECADYIDVI